MAQAGAALADRALHPWNSEARPSCRAMLRMLASSGCDLSTDSCARVLRTSNGVVMAPASPPDTAPAAAQGWVCGSRWRSVSGGVGMSHKEAWSSTHSSGAGRQESQTQRIPAQHSGHTADRLAGTHLSRLL